MCRSRQPRKNMQSTPPISASGTMPSKPMSSIANWEPMALAKKNFNIRWHASLVAEAFRILMRGGIYLYPGDNRQGYANGRLRLLYEANPLACIIEQAGGACTMAGNVFSILSPPLCTNAYHSFSAAKKRWRKSHTIIASRILSVIVPRFFASAGFSARWKPDRVAETPHNLCHRFLGGRHDDGEAYLRADIPPGRHRSRLYRGRRVSPPRP